MDTTGLSIHVLRHTWSSWHLAAGVSWDDVARGMGHASTAMLHKTYAHLTPAELRSRYLPGERVESVEPVHSVRSKATAKQALSGAGGRNRTNDLGIMIPKGRPHREGFSLRGKRRAARCGRTTLPRPCPTRAVADRSPCDGRWRGVGWTGEPTETTTDGPPSDAAPRMYALKPLVAR